MLALAREMTPSYHRRMGERPGDPDGHPQHASDAGEGLTGGVGTPSSTGSTDVVAPTPLGASGDALGGNQGTATRDGSDERNKQIRQFHPSYLRYDVASERAQILEANERVRQESLAREPSTTTLTPSVIDDELPDDSRSDTRGMSVTVTPDTVSSGFNCGFIHFTATCSDSSLDDYIWEISFKNPSTGAFDFHRQGIGATSAAGIWVPNIIGFDIDFSTYHQAAFASNGSASFIIHCWTLKSGMFGPTADSNPVTLDFTAPACVRLRSVAVNKNRFGGSRTARSRP